MWRIYSAKIRLVAEKGMLEETTQTLENKKNQLEIDKRNLKWRKPPKVKI